MVEETHKKRGPDRLGPGTVGDFSAAVIQKNFLSPNSVKLHAFEVKCFSGDAIYGAQQAANYTRWAHYGYLIWHVPKELIRSQNYNRVVDTCLSHGVGFIHFDNPEVYDGYVMASPADQKAPSKQNISDFVECRFSEAHRNQLHKWYSS